MTVPPQPTLTYPCPYCHEGHPVAVRLAGAIAVVRCPQLGASRAVELVMGPPPFLLTGIADA